MNSKFILLNKTYSLIEYYNNILPNYSKKEIILKQSIEKTLYEQIEALFAFNINIQERIRQKYLKDYMVKLSMIDFYTNTSYHKKLLSKRQFEVIGRKIVELRKIAHGLQKNEEN